MAIARYRSYLVRVWTSAGSDGPQWAGRVESVQDEQEHRRFNDPDALLAYLRNALVGGIQGQDGTASPPRPPDAGRPDQPARPHRILDRS